MNSDNPFVIVATGCAFMAISAILIIAVGILVIGWSLDIIS